jgi:hypothetical protein
MPVISGEGNLVTTLFSNDPADCNIVPGQLSLLCNFNGIDQYDVSLRNLIDRNDFFKAVRACFFDNSRQAEDVIMSITNTNQTLLFPGNTQGFLPVLMNPDCEFSLSCVSGTETFKINLLNFMPPAAIIWAATIP